jgi:hypothetical protein
MERVGSLAAAMCRHVDYFRLFDQLPFHVYLQDVTGSFLWVNAMQHAFNQNITQKTLPDILGCQLEEVYSFVSNIEHVVENNKKVLTNIQPYDFLERVSFDNTDRVYYTRKAPFLDERQQVLGMYGYSVEVTSILKTLPTQLSPPTFEQALLA